MKPESCYPDGIDPSSARQEAKREKLIDAGNTFEAVARQWYERKKDGWSPKHATKVISRLQSNIFPQIGNMPIKSITPPIMLTTLQQIEKRGAYELTKNLRQYCSQVFRYAVPLGLVERDVTVDLSSALQTRKVTHLASIPPNELPQLIRDIDRNEARMYPITRLMFELMLHTFVRTVELIEARWDEFDLEAAQWVIPAERMKMRKTHIVPLSRQSISILKELKQHSTYHEWVFPSPQSPRKHMSNNAILKGLERMGYRGRMTGHGFRSLAMTTILEKLHYPFDVVDAQLAHAKRNSLGEAYDRAKYLQQRTEMMQSWSDYIEKFTNNRR